MEHKNLISTYQSMLESRGQMPKDAIDAINAALGTRYATNDLGKWRRGDRTTPPPVRDFMLRAVLGHAIHQVGGRLPRNDEALESLATMLTPPPIGESAQKHPL